MVDNKRLQQIFNLYDDFYKSFLRKGKLPLRSTKAGFWGYTPPKNAYELFKKIKLEKYKRFLDLGSGDSCVVMIATLFTEAVGIELDEELYKKSLEFKKKLKIKATIKNKDYLEEDFSKYDIIFINPDNPFSKGLEKKLKKEFKGLLLVYNIVHHPLHLKKRKKIWVEQIPVMSYDF